MKIPTQKYSGIVCRGAWAFGTACGRCQKCMDTKPEQELQEVEQLQQTIAEQQKVINGEYGLMTDIDRINKINKRIQELQQPNKDGLTLTLDSVAHIINWEFDEEYTEEDIERLLEGGI